MPMTISEVARLTGLSIHTLRYYDECGLLPPGAADGQRSPPV